MKKYDLAFSTEYYQFYILDAETKSQTDADDFWNDQADELRLAVSDGLLGVTIATYGDTNGELRFLDKEPEVDQEANHIVECSLNLSSGKLEIRNCTAFEVKFELQLDKDNYRTRISSFKLDTVENDQGEDFYIIDLWKATFEAPKLLKKYEEIF